MNPIDGSGAGQVDVGVEVAQQTVGQAVGQGAQLFLGVLDHGAERGVAGDHLRPAQPTDGQRHRVFGGEPAHGARQVDVGAPGPRRGRGLRRRCRSARRGCPRNSSHANAKAISRMSCTPGVERCGHLTEQQAGGLGVQRCRQVPGAGVGVDLRGAPPAARPGSRSPAARCRPGRRTAGVWACSAEQRRPPGERCSARRQRDRLTAVVLGPGDVEVFEQDPPGHRVDGQVVNDQRQLAGGRPPTARSASPRRPGSTATAPPTSASSDNASTVCRHSRGVDRTRLGHLQ